MIRASSLFQRAACGCAVFVLGLVTVGCDGLGDDEDGSSLVPLEPTNAWTATSADSANVFLRILSEQEATVRLLRPDGEVETYSLPLEQTGEGLLVGWTQAPPQFDGQVLLRNPVEASSSYLHPDTAGTESRIFEVSVSQETVAVPVDTFDCVVYTIEESSGGLVAQASIKPGFGPVRAYLAAEDDTLKLTSTNVRE